MIPIISPNIDYSQEVRFLSKKTEELNEKIESQTKAILNRSWYESIRYFREIKK